MVNRSKSRDPRMWKKWREAGAVGTHPDIEKKSKRADLKIERPDPHHNNYKISFMSEGRDEGWRRAYAYAIMDIADKKGWRPFFQSGSRVADDRFGSAETYQMIELWECKDPKEIKAVLDDIHEEAARRMELW